jgi:phospholipase D1/2
MVPAVDITPGNRFEVHSCWSDIYDAIKCAQKFVYLTGWSFHPLIRLVRDNDDPEYEKPLGVLLKEAADRGVEVCSCLVIS